MIQPNRFGRGGPRRPVAARRRGRALVEVALVSPILLALLSGVFFGGLWVFRYQQVAALAREGARWASVHAGQYHKETGNPVATDTSVYQNAILPKAAGLNASSLSHSLTWSNNNSYPYYTTINSQNNIAATGNTVTVTVSYPWTSLPHFGSVTFTSTSVLPVSY